MRSTPPLFRWLLLATLCAVLAACSRGPTPGEQFAQSLLAAFERSAGSGEPLRVSEVTSFKWDRMHVFPAKTSLKDLSETLESPVPYDIFQMKLPDRDDITLIVFRNDTLITAEIALERVQLDFDVPGVLTLSPSEAVFAVSPAGRVLSVVGR